MTQINADYQGRRTWVEPDPTAHQTESPIHRVNFRFSPLIICENLRNAHDYRNSQSWMGFLEDSIAPLAFRIEQSWMGFLEDSILRLIMNRYGSTQ